MQTADLKCHVELVFSAGDVPGTMNLLAQATTPDGLPLAQLVNERVKVGSVVSFGPVIFNLNLSRTIPLLVPSKPG